MTINANMSDLPLVMTTKEAAKLLGMSHRTLEDWRLTGTGPRFILFGRTVRYRMSDLKLFMDRPAYGNTAEARHAA